MSAADADLRAVPRIPKPDLSVCGLFERGHHAHPVQVSLALKNVGDDGRFQRVELVEVGAAELDGRPIARVRLRAVGAAEGSTQAGGSVLGDGDGVLDLVGHDPELVRSLRAVDQPVFVWEERYGVLFVMTEQGRDVMGTGAVTLAAEATVGPCRVEP
jgi:hypothetical protein